MCLFRLLITQIDSISQLKLVITTYVCMYVHIYRRRVFWGKLLYKYVRCRVPHAAIASTGSRTCTSKSVVLIYLYSSCVLVALVSSTYSYTRTGIAEIGTRFDW